MVMDEMTSFRKNALLGNMCKEGKDAWFACHGDKEKLVSLCLEQRFIPFFCTYCSEGKGLSKDYILSEYADYINDKKVLYDCDGVHGYSYGLFVDYKADIVVLNVDVAHFMFCDGITISVQETKCPILYISNHSNTRICCDGYNSIKIYVFDDSKVEITDLDKDSSVIVYRYSDDACVNKGDFCFGDVKDFRKDLRI